MEQIEIWERSGLVEAFLQDYLPPAYQSNVEIKGYNGQNCLDRRGEISLLLVGPDAGIEESTLMPACRLLMLPGTAAPLARRCKAACVMSYGLSSRDSLTCSSIEGSNCVLSIQRELMTLQGARVEQQELVLPALTPDPLTQMAGVALLLLLGVSAEEIPALLEKKRR